MVKSLRDEDTDTANIAEIFRLCRELQASTGRPVVPDGHLVGALGEAFVDRTKGLVPAAASTKGYDGKERGKNGREVQIKTTTRNRIAVSGTTYEAERLLAAVYLDRETAEFTLVYYGPIAAAFEIAGDRVKPGQWTISLRQLAAHADNTEPDPFA